MTSTSEYPDGWPDDDFVPTEELARRQASNRSHRSTTWPSRTSGSPTREYEAFLTDLYAARRAGLA